jgi:hypothetical protein
MVLLEIEVMESGCLEEREVSILTALPILINATSPVVPLAEVVHPPPYQLFHALELFERPLADH